MNNLIINGIDHSKFDLEWAKRGGKVYFLFEQYGDDLYSRVWGLFDYSSVAGMILLATKVFDDPFRKSNRKECICYLGGNDDWLVSGNHDFRDLRMATPSECAEAGIEYIEPPAVWRDIDSLEAQLAEARKDSERLDLIG